MSTSPMLERIWEDFQAAKKGREVERMKVCLKEFDLEYNPATLPRYAPQKQMARRGAMLRAIEAIEKWHDRQSQLPAEEGSW